MNNTKRLLIMGVKIKALADAVGMQRTNLSKIMNGERKANLDLARRLASAADSLTNVRVFDPNDFNADLSPNYKNVCDEVMFRVHCVVTKQTVYQSAQELQEACNDDLDLLVCLNNLVSGEHSQTWGSLLIELKPDDEPGW